MNVNTDGWVDNSKRFCTECAFCGTNASRDSNLYKCFAPQNYRETNLIDGAKMYHKMYCSDTRYTASLCAKGGTWFVARPMEIVTPVQAPPSRVKPTRGEDLASALGM